MNKIFIIIVLFSTVLTAQTGSLKGKISEHGFGIPGVNVLITGTTIGGVSDESGYYSITSIPQGNYTVRFSSVGYETLNKDINITSGKTILLNVEMKTSLIQVQEVEVLGKSMQQQSDTRVSVIDLKPENARILPGAVQDVLRTLQSLPGVLAPSDFTSQLVVRGSGPDQNLIIMDDVEVFSPYRLYGVISMFNPEAVSDINLITGGFPANYGDRLSAVLDVTNREGSRSSGITGNLNASIVSANLILEGKNPFNIKGSWLFNSRRTYYDLVIEPFVKKAKLVEENTAFPNFYDFQGKMVFGPFNGHKILLNGIYSRDGVNIISGSERPTPDSISIQDLSKNDLAAAAWHYSPSDKLFNKLIFSWYHNSGDADMDAEILDPTLNREQFEDALPDTLSSYLLGFGFSSEYSYRKYSIDDKLVYYWGDHHLEAGAGVDFMRTILNMSFKFSPELKAILASNPNFRAILNDIMDVRDYSRYRAYLHNNFKISEKLYLQPGIRFDYYNILQKGYFAPRLGLSYALDDLTTLRLVYGNYYQSPGYEKLRDANILFDLSEENTKKLDAEIATHYVLSLDRWLNEEWKVKFESYYKKFDDLIVQQRVRGNQYFTERVPGKDARYSDAWTRPVPIPSDSITQVPVNNSYGDAYGFEVLLEKKNLVGRNILSGWLSYALAYANRHEDGLKLPFRYDQRHTMNIVLEYQANDWLNIGLRFQYGSGFPFTEPVGIKPRINLVDQNFDGTAETAEIATRRSAAGFPEKVIYDIDFGPRENRFKSRKPDYHRLDLRFTAAADFWNLDWNFYLDVINIYNRTNVINYDYFVTENLTLDKKATGMFPILPTLGFIVKF